LFTPEQMKEEHAIWTRALARQRATFYDGMADVLAEFRLRGGKIAVVSHSQGDNIRKDYAARTQLLAFSRDSAVLYTD
jgi:beta-phosphoglucomutase-like phosphatase (HAD superfamily)